MNRLKKIIENTFDFFIFLLFYLKEMVKANLLLARDILSPRMKISPAIVKIPIRASSGIQLLALFNLITMTPGSLCLDIDADKTHIYVHGLYVKDRDSFEKEIREGMEKRIMEVFE
ncbi:MAG TPA: Na+/H+ antiporter subunit E [Lentimicrobium sp.]|jgi:multicomponent Na+:H+ antiporter subunit E|nr:Na+/H+ antiporter subunit E [Lentimicrobium sp.]